MQNSAKNSKFGNNIYNFLLLLILYEYYKWILLKIGIKN